MALTIPCPTSRVVEIEEYLEHVRDHVDIRDFGSLAASAPEFRALANDKALVVKALNRRVEDFVNGSPLPTAQAIPLGRNDNFFVRANIWPATADMASGRAYQDQFAYNLAHDHNFSFLTVNYLGPGYETEIYEYDYDKVEGYVGESVDLRFLEKARFGGDQVMLYRQSKDAHIQYAPEELTVTLNLIVATPEVRFRDQYFFDLKTRTISSYPNDLQASGRAAFVRLAGKIGNADTYELLNDLALSHPCRRTRLSAFDALSVQQPKQALQIWEKASVDRAPLVANAARRRIKELEQT